MFVLSGVCKSDLKSQENSGEVKNSLILFTFPVQLSAFLLTNC